MSEVEYRVWVELTSESGQRKRTFREKFAQIQQGREAMNQLMEQELARLRAQPQLVVREREEQRQPMVYTLMFFIIGLSVILSYQWYTEPPSWRPEAPFVILFGILVAAIIYKMTKYSFVIRPRPCLQCGRQAPADAVLCPYCGHRF